MTERLPANVDAERFVLGAILLDDVVFPDGLSLDHFSLETHRRILRPMLDLRSRGERIDRVTLASELEKRGELQNCGGYSYLVSLDDGIPHLPKIDAYLRILQDCATRRRLMAACDHLRNRAACGTEDLSDILSHGQELFASASTTSGAYRSIDDLPPISECGAADIEFIRNPELQRGAWSRSRAILEAARALS